MNRLNRRETLSMLGLGFLSYRKAGPENDAAPSEPPSPLDLHSWIRPVPPTAVLREEGYYIWGGSAVRADDGRYHMFYARWRKEHGFEAWATHSEVAHAVGESPVGPFRNVDVTLPERGATYWDGHCTLNPAVYRFGDKFYLYYTGNYGNREKTEGINWSHRNHQRVGVAVADQPEGPWERFEHPLIDVSANDDAPDSLMTANPAAVRRPDGDILLIYNCVSKHRPLPFGGPVVHLAATAPSPTGPFTKNLDPIFTAEGDDFPTEDPYIWYDSARERYFAMVKDMKGAFSGVGQALVLFESADGFAWKVAVNPLVSKRQIPWADRATENVARLERPQLIFHNGEPAVLYCAVMEKDGETYNVHIPLQAPARASAHRNRYREKYVPGSWPSRPASS